MNSLQYHNNTQPWCWSLITFVERRYIVRNVRTMLRTYICWTIRGIVCKGRFKFNFLCGKYPDWQRRLAHSYRAQLKEKIGKRNQIRHCKVKWKQIAIVGASWTLMQIFYNFLELILSLIKHWWKDGIYKIAIINIFISLR